MSVEDVFWFIAVLEAENSIFCLLNLLIRTTKSFESLEIIFICSYMAWAEPKWKNHEINMKNLGDFSFGEDKFSLPSSTLNMLWTWNLSWKFMFTWLFCSFVPCQTPAKLHIMRIYCAFFWWLVRLDQWSWVLLGFHVCKSLYLTMLSHHLLWRRYFQL